ncbi:hypothetical protein G9C85_01675 [Halorubellus sp. JP-L1]|uniref:hypothetical protein n=1 Tax=Halorubellus sp. JP-L1 TaxID=2715753 RepID=UPI00140B5289|nr:hypothetical protein [Halorubellus sp. JP-L1]NHN40346.1 hypothetical protein [Halorubellus sp. JP-L1]
MRTSSSKTLVVIALAGCAVVALAGCSALSDNRQTRTALDVNDSECTAREAVRNGSVVAFDAARDHAPDPDVLASAHRRALAERSYTVSISTEMTNRSGIVVRSTRTSTIASDHSRYRTVAHANYSDDRQSTVRTYANGTHVWKRYVGPNTDEVRLRSSVGQVVPPAAQNETGIDEILDGLYETNVTDVVQVDAPRAAVDGDVYRMYANESVRAGTTDEDVAHALTVTESGRILTYDYRYDTQDVDGRNVTVHVRVEFHAVDATTVTPPEWVPENATDADATDANVTNADATDADYSRRTSITGFDARTSHSTGFERSRPGTAPRPRPTVFV